MKDKFKEEVLRKIVSNICDGYVDSIISSIEENNTNNFSFTIVSANFIAELKEKNIIVELAEVFDDMVKDRIYREISKCNCDKNKIKIEMVYLKLKRNKISKLFKYRNKQLLDEMIGENKYKFTYLDLKREEEAKEYIDILKKKYNILVMEYDEEDDFYFDENLFKIISITPTKRIENKKIT